MDRLLILTRNDSSGAAYSENQTVGADAAASTKVADFRVAGTDFSRSLRWRLHLVTKAAVIAAPEAGDVQPSLNVKFQTSDDNETFVDLVDKDFATAAITTANGALLVNELLPEGLKRYNRLYFTLGGSATTRSVVLLGYIDDRQMNS